jgi:hypothetical protein
MLKRALPISVVCLLVLATSASAAGEGAYFRQLRAHRPYQALSVTGSSGGHPLLHPNRLTIGFSSQSDGGGKKETDLGWGADCNEHSDPVRVTAHRIRPGKGYGWTTAMECIGTPQREDRWLESFFGAALSWRLRDGHLILAGSRGRIVLRHHPYPQE